jgi:hypothetical protein
MRKKSRIDFRKNAINVLEVSQKKCFYRGQQIAQWIAQYRLKGDMVRNLRTVIFDANNQ